ncbi:hypothetical protein M0805_000066 [Coniferiporia weirii]|nr:hypothetical protein M0805_000066 [Coniferiporia weirii]
MSIAPGTYKLVNVLGNNALDLSGGDNKSIIGFTEHGGGNQQWVVSAPDEDDNQTLQGATSGLYLAIEGPPQNYERLVASSYATKWAIRRDGSDRSVWRVFWPGTGLNFDLSDRGNPTPGTPIQLWEATEGKNQLWKFELALQFEVMSSTKAAVYQPLPQSAMDFSMLKESAESSAQCDQEASCHGHRGCHKERRRRVFHFAAASISLLVIFALLASFLDWETVLGLTTDLGGGLLGKRQSTGTTTTGSGDSTFVKNKLYVIVIVVGFVVVVILAIMLSAWCCRGAFENPCCCPCYLCACCGGLACLECIGCGLCAEGLAES